MRALLACLLPLAAAAAGAAETRALVVAGLGGSADYETAFQRQAKDTADALRGVAEDVTLLLGGMASRERVGAEVAGLGRRAAATDRLLLVLIGHGSYDDRDYRFNVPGPDITGATLAQWLDGVSAGHQTVVVATSASGALQPLLSGPGRTLITATRSGAEGNVSVFARYFSEALQEPGADLDKDGLVSVREAFDFAEAGVAEYYAAADRMATEHPVLEGPAEAVPRLALARLQESPAFVPAQGAAGRLEELEAAIDALRADKDTLEPDAYYAELQRLLLELAMARQGAGGAAP